MRAKETKQIRDCWVKIQDAFSKIDWSSYADQLLEIATEESKSHDRFRADSIERGISVHTEAKYFAIKRLYECRYTDYKPETVDFCMTQKSCFYAYSMAKNARFADTWKALESSNNFCLQVETIASWDYCDLIKPIERTPAEKQLKRMVANTGVAKY